MKQDHKLKTCIVGNSSVGKTSIVLRIHQDIFKEDTATTAGIDYNSKTHRINGQGVLVEMWDTPGQDRYKSVVTSFFRDADGVLIVFDMTNPKTIAQLGDWLGRIGEVLELTVPKILLGNKSDLKAQLGAADQQLLDRICAENSLKFMRVSAKKGEGVQEAYKALIESAYTYSYEKQRKKGKTIPVLISQDNAGKKPDRKKKCC